jgi:transcriptional regulator with XRE-family HTH domain
MAVSCSNDKQVSAIRKQHFAWPDFVGHQTPDYGEILKPPVAKNTQELAIRLRQCAQLAGSGDELARKASVPRRTLETYLSGDAEPKASRLFALARAVGVSLDWLATGEGPMMLSDRAGKGRGLGVIEGGGRPAEIDAELLGWCVQALEEFLQSRRAPLAAEKKAKVISLLYEIERE